MLRRGFTLVELMIVIVILGILAAILIPAVAAHTTQARETVLKSELRSLRHQIITYQAHHGGTLPDPDQLSALMVGKTDQSGRIDDQGSYGPYLMRFPSNPFNGRQDVKAIPAGAELTPDDTTGWLYQIDEGQFNIAANSSARDTSGRALAEY